MDKNFTDQLHKFLRDPHRVETSDKTYGEMIGGEPGMDGVMMGDPDAGDPFVSLSDGMVPLPEDTDMDRLIAAYDLIGRMGMKNFEVGYDDERILLRVQCGWYATCETGTGQGFLADQRASAHEAAEALARKLCNGGRCTHCGRVSTLWTLDQVGPRDPASLRTFCVWMREGKRWERGCAAEVPAR